MLGSRAVEDIRLQLSGREAANWPLGEGVHRLVREASGTLGFGEAARGALLAQICKDRRGLWLQVANGVRGIHVNGRSVRKVALLRPGDALYLDGIEVLVQGRVAEVTPPSSGPVRDGDIRVLLRGVGGIYHGRSLPIDQPRLVGSGREADIRIEDGEAAARHARLERHGDRLLLRDLDSTDGTLVNGVRVRDALLHPGDQLSFGPQYRFVVEAPSDATRTTPAPKEMVAEDVVVTKPRVSAGHWPWLLLAALLLAGLLGALLLFGAG